MMDKRVVQLCKLMVEQIVGISAARSTLGVVWSMMRDLVSELEQAENSSPADLENLRELDTELEAAWNCRELLDMLDEILVGLEAAGFYAGQAQDALDVSNELSLLQGEHA